MYLEDCKLLRTELEKKKREKKNGVQLSQRVIRDQYVASETLTHSICSCGRTICSAARGVTCWAWHLEDVRSGD
jgi:hypothetical protein